MFFEFLIMTTNTKLVKLLQDNLHFFPSLLLQTSKLTNASASPGAAPPCCWGSPSTAASSPHIPKSQEQLGKTWGLPLLCPLQMGEFFWGTERMVVWVWPAQQRCQPQPPSPSGHTPLRGTTANGPHGAGPYGE